VEAGKITGQLKVFAYTIAAIIFLGGSFYGGQRLRLASLQRPLHQSRLAQSINIRAGAYAISQTGAIAASPIFPAAIADSSGPSTGVAGSDSAIGSEQIEDFLNSDSPAATFQQVYMLLKEQYVDRIDSDVLLAHGAAASLITALDDPNSRFMDRAERVAVEAQADGLFQGIGVAVMVRRVQRPDGILDRQLTVVDSLPGSSAQKAGLRTGDIITSINGHWVLSYDPFAEKANDLKKLEDDPYSFNKAVDALEKQETQGYALDKAQAALDVTSATPLILIVHRPGTALPLTLNLDASVPVQVQSVESHRLANGTGYVGINVFTKTTAADFRSSLSQLDGSKGLILDLRDCSGGMLSPGIDIAKSFDPTTKFGSIYLRSDRGSKTVVDGVPTEVKPLKDGDSPSVAPVNFKGPITVLVNQGTANTAEMLAAFLHDRIGASIIGSNTFGDATAQTLFPLSDGSAFALTTGVMRTDSDLAFNTRGLMPQYALADPGHAADPDSDACIAKAEEIIAMGRSAKAASVSPKSSHSTKLAMNDINHTLSSFRAAAELKFLHARAAQLSGGHQ
jgi:carboxyl-terminal processing protease